MRNQLQLLIILAAGFLAASACGQAKPAATTEYENSIVKALKAQAENKSMQADAAQTNPYAHLEETNFPPPIKLDNDTQILIALKYGRIGFIQAYGYDTDYLRFKIAPNGAWDSLRVTRAWPDGEKEVAVANIHDQNGSIRIAVTSGALVATECRIEKKDGSVTATGAGFKYVYSSPKKGSFRIERTFGERVYIEDWEKSPAGCSISDTKDIGAKGRFEGPWPRPTKYIETPDNDPAGNSDTMYEFRESSGWIRAMIGTVEPLGEIFVRGIDSAFPKGLDLSTIAVLDVVMDPIRRITPLLARLYLGQL